MVENNVVPDNGDIATTNDALGGRPVQVCASGLSWGRRPRPYWCYVLLEEHERCTPLAHELYTEVEFQEELDPLEKVIDEGIVWPGGQGRLPAFTRAILRLCPPALPAGLESGHGYCQKMALGQYEVPPVHVPAGYTEALVKKEAANLAEAEEQRVKGMAALGNSFHTVAVACLLDLWLCSRGIRTDPLETRSVVQEWHVEIGQPEMDPMGQLNLEVP